MTKKDRVLKLLNEQETILNMLIVFFKDNQIEYIHKEEYQELEKAYNNNQAIQEEINID